MDEDFDSRMDNLKHAAMRKRNERLEREVNRLYPSNIPTPLYENNIQRELYAGATSIGEEIRKDLWQSDKKDDSKSDKKYTLAEVRAIREKLAEDDLRMETVDDSTEPPHEARFEDIDPDEDTDFFTASEAEDSVSLKSEIDSSSGDETISGEKSNDINVDKVEDLFEKNEELNPSLEAVSKKVQILKDKQQGESSNLEDLNKVLVDTGEEQEHKRFIQANEAEYENIKKEFDKVLAINVTMSQILSDNAIRDNNEKITKIIQEIVPKLDTEYLETHPDVDEKVSSMVHRLTGRYNVGNSLLKTRERNRDEIRDAIVTIVAINNKYLHDDEDNSPLALGRMQSVLDVLNKQLGDNDFKVNRPEEWRIGKEFSDKLREKILVIMNFQKTEMELERMKRMYKATDAFNSLDKENYPSEFTTKPGEKVDSKYDYRFKPYKMMNKNQMNNTDVADIANTNFLKHQIEESVRKRTDEARSLNDLFDSGKIRNMSVDRLLQMYYSSEMNLTNEQRGEIANTIVVKQKHAPNELKTEYGNMVLKAWPTLSQEAKRSLVESLTTKYNYLYAFPILKGKIKKFESLSRVLPLDKSAGEDGLTRDKKKSKSELELGEYLDSIYGRENNENLKKIILEDSNMVEPSRFLKKIQSDVDNVGSEEYKLYLNRRENTKNSVLASDIMTEWEKMLSDDGEIVSSNKLSKVILDIKNILISNRNTSMLKEFDKDLRQLSDVDAVRKILTSMHVQYPSLSYTPERNREGGNTDSRVNRLTNLTSYGLKLLNVLALTPDEEDEGHREELTDTIDQISELSGKPFDFESDSSNIEDYLKNIVPNKNQLVRDMKHDLLTQLSYHKMHMFLLGSAVQKFYKIDDLNDLTALYVSLLVNNTDTSEVSQSNVYSLSLIHISEPTRPY